MFTATNTVAGHGLAVAIGVCGIVLGVLVMLALRRLEKSGSLA